MKLSALVSLFSALPLAIAGQASGTWGDWGSSQLTTWEKIHETLNLYPFAIDTKNTTLFASVFAPTATANYTGPPPFSNLIGLDQIASTLILTVSQVLSQHQLGTSVINIADGAKTAAASTYFTATLFGLPGGPNNGKYVYLYGRYEDQLSDLGGSANGWRITRRQLVFMGPLIGDCELGGGCPT